MIMYDTDTDIDSDIDSDIDPDISAYDWKYSTVSYHKVTIPVHV